MTPEARHDWIIAFLKARPGDCVNVLYSDFVWDYIEATNARCGVHFFGAPTCPQLGRDLGALYRAGRLTRYATGLPRGDAAMGFPKWVYSYRLPPDKR
jgi:hypothetical protein